jgi:hypothetical protein
MHFAAFAGGPAERTMLLILNLSAEVEVDALAEEAHLLRSQGQLVVDRFVLSLSGRFSHGWHSFHLGFS